MEQTLYIPVSNEIASAIIRLADDPKAGDNHPAAYLRSLIAREEGSYMFRCSIKKIEEAIRCLLSVMVSVNQVLDFMEMQEEALLRYEKEIQGFLSVFHPQSNKKLN
ncbi:MAG: hypothetical protein IJ504_01110 [Bacteroidales bacterium]|nr:hypothetical protein [Bacteroidales bacterium]